MATRLLIEDPHRVTHGDPAGQWSRGVGNHLDAARARDREHGLSRLGQVTRVHVPRRHGPRERGLQHDVIPVRPGFGQAGFRHLHPGPGLVELLLGRRAIAHQVLQPLIGLHGHRHVGLGRRHAGLDASVIQADERLAATDLRAHVHEHRTDRTTGTGRELRFLDRHHARSHELRTGSPDNGAHGDVLRLVGSLHPARLAAIAACHGEREHGNQEQQ